MKNNSRWYSLLIVGLALLLVSSFIGCGQSQSKAYQEGYKTGFTDGHKAGLAQSGTETTPAPSTSQGTPRQETPRQDTPRQDTPRQETPRQETPPQETPPQGTPKTDTSVTSKVGLLADAISWDKAKDYIGDRITVYGPVAGTSYSATNKGGPPG